MSLREMILNIIRYHMTLARDPKQYVIIASWQWTPGCGGIWETSGRHLGKHLGEPWGHLGGPGDMGGIREPNVFKHLCFTSQSGAGNRFACTGRARPSR